jgi:hypothetical protein
MHYCTFLQHINSGIEALTKIHVLCFNTWNFAKSRVVFFCDLNANAKSFESFQERIYLRSNGAHRGTFKHTKNNQFCEKIRSKMDFVSLSTFSTKFNRNIFSRKANKATLPGTSKFSRKNF